MASSRMAVAAERRQKHDSWHKRADMHLRMGRMQEAEEMLNGMEKDEQEATGEAAARKARQAKDQDKPASQPSKENTNGGSIRLPHHLLPTSMTSYGSIQPMQPPVDRINSQGL